MKLEWEESVPSGEDFPARTGTFSRSMRMASGRFEPVIPCTNPRCRGGGFEVEFLVESMLSERLEERTGYLVCVGWEGEQGSRKEGTPCTKAIGYRVRLSYRGRRGRIGEKAATG